MIAKLIGAFILILVGIQLFPSINLQVVNSIQQENLTGLSKFILQLVPLMFALGVLTFALAIGYMAIRETGIVGDDNLNEYTIKEKDDEQTYKEYVEERLAVERMMK